MPNNNYRFKQVIVVRGDLKLSKGKLAVQVAHAAVSSCMLALEQRRDWVEGWIEDGQPKIVCKVGDLDALLKLYKDAADLGLPTVLVKDAGKTEIPPGTITCVGIGPAPIELVDKLTRKLPLL